MGSEATGGGEMSYTLDCVYTVCLIHDSTGKKTNERDEHAGLFRFCAPFSMHKTVCSLVYEHDVRSTTRKFRKYLQHKNTTHTQL